MFWTFLLAHLTADYPLQTDRLVMAKKHLPGLTIHVAIHWVVMMVLFLPVIGIMWPYILIVALFHFGIDAFKNFLSGRRPQWVIGPYLFDQVLHLSSLLLVSAWAAQTTDLPAWQVTNPWVVYASGLLAATYVWFVSERILVYRIDNRQISVTSTMWPRMGVRLLLFVLLAAPAAFAWFIALFAIVIIAVLYSRYNYPRSWLFIDIAVASISALLVRAILLIW